MSLTSGKGPLGHHRTGWFSSPVPAGTVWVEPHRRRIVAELDGRTVIDTERALLVHRTGASLAYAFLPEDVGDLAGEPEPEAPGYVHVPWDAVDTWFEEGRRLVHYPPNPYHRVDIRPTRRRLRVTVAGQVLVDTDDTLVVFETSLTTKLYVDPAHVRTDLLRRSETWSWCNYKGDATWWTFVSGDTVVEDVGWSYEEPLDESRALLGCLSFDPEVVLVEAELPG